MEKILVFAPHNDDEILGVGGTIAKYIRENNEVYVCELTILTWNLWNKLSKRLKKHIIYWA